MASPSPLIEFHRRAGATLLAYGPQSQSVDSDAPAASGLPVVDLVGTYGSLELEYAAVRRHCGLLDMPSRGLVEVTGPERIEFLNRMLTQDLRPGKKDLSAYSLARSLWLSRKGRVESDLRVCVLPDRVLLEVDAIAAARTASTLASFVIMEDCVVRDVSAAFHCLALHGPTALALLSTVFQPKGGAPAIDALPASGGVTRGAIADAAVLVIRDDMTLAPGFALIAATDHALTVAQAVIRAGHDATHEAPREGFSLPVLAPEAPRSASRFRLAPVGWMAFNIARIEAGTPLFNIDFGTENLPAETGVLASRVSFTKGCYLGQEVVARMHARQQSKQHLVAVKFENVGTSDDRPYPLLPEQGAALSAGDVQVGRITSSTLSPLLAMAPVAFAQVRSTHTAPGTVLTAQSEGQSIRGVVQAGLEFGVGVKSARE